MIRIGLELIRIIVIFLVFGAILGGVAKLIYKILGINVDHTTGGWLVGCSILILLFVLYRNKSLGLYKEEGKVKLPKLVSLFLVSFSVLLFILAPLFR